MYVRVDIVDDGYKAIEDALPHLLTESKHIPFADTKYVHDAENSPSVETARIEVDGVPEPLPVRSVADAILEASVLLMHGLWMQKARPHTSSTVPALNQPFNVRRYKVAKGECACDERT